ncbi:MAG: ACT domain-containing protein, partial [Phycisphaerae bacterium]
KKANLSFLIGISDLVAAEEAIGQIKSEINCDNVFVRDDIAEISVVGVGMRTHYGVAERMFGSLAKAKINIDSITTSEIRISCVVSIKQADEALRTVSVAFELNKPPQERTK